MTLVYPAFFGDEYPVEQRTPLPPGHKPQVFGNAIVRGVKMTPFGAEITLVVPFGTEVIPAINTPEAPTTAQ